MPSREVTEGRLRNSEIQAELHKHLSNLSIQERANSVDAFPSLFPDVPSRTTLIEHNIDVSSGLHLSG